MDNDNALLETARNLYKGLRFGWKYRGVKVLEAAELGPSPYTSPYIP